MKLFRTTASSVRNYFRLVLDGNLRLDHGRLGNECRIKAGNYKIFRETVNPKSQGETVILIIGFRLKLIRSNVFLHWLFQRICILTTPFWSGLDGFSTKLWMVDPKTMGYLGIYDWKGRKEAKAYIDFLIPILKSFSVKGSVWSDKAYLNSLQEFLDKHQIIEK